MGMGALCVIPNGYQPDSTICGTSTKSSPMRKPAKDQRTDQCEGGLAATFAGIKSFQTPQEAVADVDAIYTDVWTSMEVWN